MPHTGSTFAAALAGGRAGLNWCWSHRTSLSRSSHHAQQLLTCSRCGSCLVQLYFDDDMSKADFAAYRRWCPACIDWGNPAQLSIFYCTHAVRASIERAQSHYRQAIGADVWVLAYYPEGLTLTLHPLIPEAPW